MQSAGLILQEVRKLKTVDLGYVEHFGFRDGISQPVIAGLSQTETLLDTIQPGEILLGYTNEYNLYTERPLLDSDADPKGLLPRDVSNSGKKDLGRNGSYLVFRQLYQDVQGFWQFLDHTVKGSGDGSNADARTKLAAKFIGRWPSGAPLVKTPDYDDPTLAGSNDFGYYQTDPYGYNCPIGAHIRRANPRDSLDPQPGSKKSIDIGKRHRILRRGREYGMPINPDALFHNDLSVSEEQDRGLHFLCLCGNIARQFEFVQHTWMNNPNFNALYHDADPIVGSHASRESTFSVQKRPVTKRITDLPQFVTVQGGAYFFLPGIRAIRYLATLGF